MVSNIVFLKAYSRSIYVSFLFFARFIYEICVSLTRKIIQFVWQSSAVYFSQV